MTSRSLFFLVLSSLSWFIRLVKCHDQCIEESCSWGAENPAAKDILPRQQQCRLYVAESSIPNAGLGMYSGVSLEEGDEIHSEIVIQTIDLERQLKLRKAETSNAQGLTDDHVECRFWAEHDECEKNPNYMKRHCTKSCYDVEHGIPNTHVSPSLLASYYWSASVGHGSFFAKSAESLLPGVGMLANSHPGLLNVRMTRPLYDNAGLDRRTDPGVGAFSSYHNYRFLANTNIVPGMEIFAEYGDAWFAGREDKFGLIPLSDDYAASDEIVHNFWSTLNGLGLKNNTALIQDAWNLARNDLLEKNTRIQMVLPKSISGMEPYEPNNFSAAMHSFPNVIREIDWLNEHGLCLDGLRVAPSTIPQAGRGAFATRKFMKGEIISPVPVVHIERQALQMYQENDDNFIENHGEQQLLLNYCYGHPQSSILLFPYAPAVNFINHDRNPNAVLRWSSMNSHQSEWLQLSTHEILEKPYAGLILEIIATQDIDEGTEIFIDYGNEWDAAWSEYIESWEPHDVSDDFYPIEVLNTDPIVRTEDEQQDEPYPNNVMIYCFLLKPKQEDSSDDDDDDTDSYPWDLKGQTLDRLMRHLSNAKPCRILERSYDQESFSTSYKIQAELSDQNSIIMTGVPREAIEFLYRSYEADQFIATSFRHDIQIPDDIFPQTWRDLEIESINSTSDEMYQISLENDDTLLSHQ